MKNQQQAVCFKVYFPAEKEKGRRMEEEGLREKMRKKRGLEREKMRKRGLEREKMREEWRKKTRRGRC